MNRILALAALIGFSVSAHAQSPGVWPHSQITRADTDVNLQAKANVNNPTLNNSVLNSARVNTGLFNFDTVNIDPNNGQWAQLPGNSLPCHQVGQVYVLSTLCVQSQANSPLEMYAYSMGLVDTDPGGTYTPDPTGTQVPGHAGTDKVDLFLAASQRSNYSNIWGINEVATAEAGSTGGVAGFELDMNRFNPCASKIGTGWIGDATCSQFVGFWITGLNGGGTGGPAIFVTSAGGTNVGLFSDGVELAGGLAIRDAGFRDFTNSNTVLAAGATHTYGIDFYNSHILTAGMRLMSGNFWSADNSQNGQGIFWEPGPGGNGATGYSDSIYDYGLGLTLNSGGEISLNSATNTAIQGQAVYIANPDYQAGNAAGNPVQGATPYLKENADGSLNISQSGVTTGSLKVDGSVSAGNAIFSPNGRYDNLASDTPGGPITISSPVIVSQLTTDPTGAAPTSSTSACLAGQTAWDQTYEYRCIATNHWQRLARSTDTW